MKVYIKFLFLNNIFISSFDGLQWLFSSFHSKSVWARPLSVLFIYFFLNPHSHAPFAVHLAGTFSHVLDLHTYGQISCSVCSCGFAYTELKSHFVFFSHSMLCFHLIHVVVWKPGPLPPNPLTECYAMHLHVTHLFPELMMDFNSLNDTESAVLNLLLHDCLWMCIKMSWKVYSGLYLLNHKAHEYLTYL